MHNSYKLAPECGVWTFVDGCRPSDAASERSGREDTQNGWFVCVSSEEIVWSARYLACLRYGGRTSPSESPHSIWRDLAPDRFHFNWIFLSNSFWNKSSSKGHLMWRSSSSTKAREASIKELIAAALLEQLSFLRLGCIWRTSKQGRFLLCSLFLLIFCWC